MLTIANVKKTGKYGGVIRLQKMVE